MLANQVLFRAAFIRIFMCLSVCLSAWAMFALYCMWCKSQRSRVMGRWSWRARLHSTTAWCATSTATATRWSSTLTKSSYRASTPTTPRWWRISTASSNWRPRPTPSRSATRISSCRFNRTPNSRRTCALSGSDDAFRPLGFVRLTCVDLPLRNLLTLCVHVHYCYRLYVAQLKRTPDEKSSC